MAFNLNGGTPPAGFINPVKVDPGKAVTEPTGITKALTLDPADRSTYLGVDTTIRSTPSIQKGLYRLGSTMSIEGWYKDGVKWDFNTTLTEGAPAFTLTANWSGGLDRQSGVNELQDAINYNFSGMEAVTGIPNIQNNRTVSFVYVMDGDETVNGSAVSGYYNIHGKLMIIGKNPSEITNTDPQRYIFSITGDSWGPRISTESWGRTLPPALLILGNNVTVRGKADSQRAAIFLSGGGGAGRGGTLIMLDGSKITGNMNNLTTANDANRRGGAIRMFTGSIFVMEGGEIFGNGVKATDKNWLAGGIDAYGDEGTGLSGSTKVILRGGVIKDNTGPGFDLYIPGRSPIIGTPSRFDSATRFVMSGNARVGAVVLGGDNNVRRGYGVAVDAGWTGQVDNLFLDGPDSFVTLGAENNVRVIGGWNEPDASVVFTAFHSVPTPGDEYYDPNSVYVDTPPAGGIRGKFMKLKEFPADNLNGPDLTGYTLGNDGKLTK